MIYKSLSEMRDVVVTCLTRAKSKGRAENGLASGLVRWSRLVAL